MRHSVLLDGALEVLRLIGEYSNGPHREMLVDPALYGYLTGRFGQMSRQHQLHLPGSSRPKRIDFRHGSTNPTVIEFAVRPPAGGPQLYGSQNSSELRKLTRVPQSRAKSRILLLLDLSSSPISKGSLRPTYLSVTSGPGRFTRHSVRVVYAQVDVQYSFLWKP